MSTPRRRRTVLSVPATNERAIARSRTLPVDEVMLDLEDSVAPSQKAGARLAAVRALRDGGWGACIRSVRVNSWATAWTCADLMALLEGAGDVIDCIVLPKASGPEHVTALDLMLSQLERAAGLRVGAIGLEVQIEDAAGLVAVDAIAVASPRTEALVYGPGDMMAALGMRSTSIGAQPVGYPHDAHHYALLRILVAARARGLQAIDGPFPGVRDPVGLREAKLRSAALGYDGAWVIHPAQVDTVNEVFTPSAEEQRAARSLLQAYAEAVSTDAQGALLLDGVMVDEATRRQAEAVVARGLPD